MSSTTRLLLAILALCASVGVSDKLEDIVKEFAPCAILCYNAAAFDGECDVGNFGCICSNPGSLVVKMKICAGKACDGTKPGNGTDLNLLMEQLCGAFDSKPPTTEIAAASSLMKAEYASVTKTATSNPLPKATNHAPAPAGTEAAMGIWGALAVAALVM